MSEKPCLKVLLACARPLVAMKGKKLVPMDVSRPGAEMEAVKNGLKSLNREIQMVVHNAATLPEVNTALMNAEPGVDILHFIGHGDEDTGALCFEDEFGVARLVKSSELARLAKGSVRLLVTMSCFSEKAVRWLFRRDSEQTVPAAVCIKGKYPVEARATELFYGALYSGLAWGRTLKQSFDEAVDAVRVDDMVGEAAMPDTKGQPTPCKRFVLKGDGSLAFPGVPEGSVKIEEVIRKSPHTKMEERTDELFVGRKLDIVALGRLLGPPRLGLKERRPRIITLYGEGGIGKTRLAQAAADWLADRGKFPGGIFEVACDGASDARGMAIAILKRLGVAEAEQVPKPGDTLMKILNGYKERSLLLLDNLDNLFDEKKYSGEAGRLLKRCLTASASLGILATCRWPLNLGADEHAFIVDPMSFEDALELFILCIPDPDIQKELRGIREARQMASLRRILEMAAGMPLCVILAARRLTRHGETLETLLKKAADDLEKTMDAPELKHLPERLRSLRASLDLSYNCLSEPARGLFARMSFFPGGLYRGLGDHRELLGDGWTDAAEEVTRYALARYDRRLNCYTMLGPVIEYAREKLDASDGDGFRRRVAEFWAEFARWYDLMLNVQPAAQEQTARILRLSDNPEEQREKQEAMRSEAYTALTSEVDNLVHAALWALGAKEETGLGIVNALEDYLRLRAGWYTQEQLYRLALNLRRQLAEANPEEYMPDVAMTLNNMGVLLDNMGHPDKALGRYVEALEIYRNLSQAYPDAYMPDVATTLNKMGNLQASMGHPDEALGRYVEALEIYREFFRRYPPAYARNLIIALRSAKGVYEKLGMKKKAKECEREMEEANKEIGKLGNGRKSGNGGN